MLSKQMLNGAGKKVRKKEVEKNAWSNVHGQPGIKLSAIEISGFRFVSCQSDHFLHFVSGSSPVLRSSLKKYSPSLSAFSFPRVRLVIPGEADLQEKQSELKL